MTGGFKLIEVALPLPLDKTFTYRAAGPLSPLAKAGVRVLVPFRRTRLVGLCLGRDEAAPHTELKDVLDVIDDRPLFGPSYPPLLRFAAQYYQAPIGLAAATILPFAMGQPVSEPPPGKLDPPRVKRRQAWKIAVKDDFEQILADIAHGLTVKQAAAAEFLRGRDQLPIGDLKKVAASPLDMARRLEAHGLIDLTPAEVIIDPLGLPLEDPAEPDKLTGAQVRSLEAVTSAMDQGRFAGLLLDGVTGSGKTEVYLQAVKAAMARGKTALVLVPEISLTVHLEGMFAARFGDSVVTIHSQISKKGRRVAWRSAAEGKAKIILGARSAIFAPIPEPGLIVVDEEHDEAYKQEDRLRYQARDLALWRAKNHHGVALLGSATPSLGSIHLVSQKRLEPLTLPSRIDQRPMPGVETVDIKGNPPDSFLSPQLEDAVARTLGNNQQVILFVGRRGYAPSVYCLDCQNPVMCPNCSVSLTLHLRPEQLLCHYCGLKIPWPAPCPTCQSSRLKPYGLGTERLLEQVTQIFPQARAMRLDRDTTQGRGALRKMLTKVAKREVDVVVGTQMITKGHHFPDITLVGVVDADLSLHFPDYKATERTFNLLVQVAGRAGRGASPGRVIVQTRRPDHYVIDCLKSNDRDRFVEIEMEYRRALFYPPFSRLINLCVAGIDPGRVSSGTDDLFQALSDAKQRIEPRHRLDVLGPAPAPLSKIGGKTRRQILIKAASAAEGAKLAWHARRTARDNKAFAGLTLTVDVDPVSVM